jgi:hypothetical protein
MFADLMDDFPPSRDRVVTLANWRKAPFCAWGFRNVRRLIPTANIAASNHAAGLEMSLENTGHIGFTSHDGNPTTISRAPSEATPLDPDRARGWRRGFDAIAEEFM